MYPGEDDMYSGTSPVVLGNQNVKSVEKAKAKQKEQKNQLTPLALDLKAYFAEERRAVGDIRSYLAKLDHPTGEDILAEYRARELYLGLIGRLEGWMDSKLTKKP